MTPEQEELREESIAIMMESRLTEEQAKRHIDNFPEIYGITPIIEKQEGLFK